jgi:hypothetical protein
VAALLDFARSGLNLSIFLSPVLYALVARDGDTLQAFLAARPFIRFSECLTAGLGVSRE